jgi:hypothetical protein
MDFFPAVGATSKTPRLEDPREASKPKPRVG